MSVADGLDNLLSDCGWTHQLLLLAGGGANSDWALWQRDRLAHRLVYLDKCVLERSLEPGVGLVEFFLGDVASTNQVVHVEGSNAALSLDEVVHHRLSHRGVIALVVTTTAVADDVDYYVLLELLAVLEGKLRHPHNRLWVVAVDVEDWCLNAFGEIC